MHVVAERMAPHVSVANDRGLRRPGCRPPPDDLYSSRTGKEKQAHRLPLLHRHALRQISQVVDIQARRLQGDYPRSVNTTDRYDTGCTSTASIPCSDVASKRSESPTLSWTTFVPYR